MRIDVTPIGAEASSVAAVAGAVVDYLEGGRRDPGAQLLDAPNVGAAAAYYADSPEGPGRWIGAGAAFQRLAGAVDPDSLQRVLEGRHPETGARLLSARGSSSRAHIASGTAALFDGDGEPLYSVSDAARLLSIRQRDVLDLVEASGGDGGADDSREWIGSLEVEGEVMIPDREISRHLELAVSGVEADAVRQGGDPDELLSVPQAARIMGVTRQYVGKLCAAAHHNRTQDHDPSGPVLPCERERAGKSVRYRIRREDLAEFIANRRPPVARVGYDVTFTTEKSLAMVAMLSTGERQQVVVAALRAANETAMGYLDRIASTARRRNQVVHTEGLLGASYFHGTSRALDPHPHYHNVVANAVVDDEGQVRTLDARGLYRHAPAAAALAEAAVRWEMRDLGLGWWRRDNGVWEISGVNETAIDAFSTRHSQISEIVEHIERQQGRPLTATEEEIVGRSSRDDKEAVDPEALKAEWAARAEAVGFDVTQCFDRHRGERAIVTEALTAAQQRRLFADLVDPDEGVCAQSSMFTRGDVLKAIADWSIQLKRRGMRRKVILPPGEVERLADQFCASDLVVQLDPSRVGGVLRRRDGTIVDDGQNQPMFTTVELLEVDERVIDRYRTGRGAGRGQVEGRLIDEATGGGEVELSGEQLNMVRAWCSSGNAVQAAVGRAGTGKTTSMRAAAAAWGAAGYRVIGCAIKGEAAEQLANDAGIEADTLALLLTQADNGQPVLDTRTVLIVDEANTIGDRDLVKLLDHAANAGATVRLIGDPAQHGSVPAGGVFNTIVDTYRSDTPELTTVFRLKDPADRANAELLRAGKINQAIEAMQASGQLVLSDTDVETHAETLRNWCEQRRDEHPHPMVHGRNRERCMLNTIAQKILVADGIVDPDHAVTCSDGRQLAVGDEVVAKHGDRKIHPDRNPKAWMRNGTRGRIVAVTHGKEPADDRILVQTAGGLLACPRRVFDRKRGGIDLAYAVTSYGVEGSTADVSTSVITTSTARSELYVDITRGRQRNTVYATRTTAPNEEAHLPQVDEDLVEGLQRRLARGTARSVHAVDPEALAVARVKRGRTLAGLLAARTRGDPGPMATAITRTIAAVKRCAASNPVDELRAVLPARPQSPHLAARWDQLVGDVAVHHAADPQPARGRGTVEQAEPLTRVLGPRKTDRASEWDQLADQLCELAVDITTWQLRFNHPDRPLYREPPAWLTRHLHDLAAAGDLGSPNDPSLDATITGIDAWRREHDVAEDAALLGTRPNNPVERLRYDQLKRQTTTATLPQSPSRGVA